MVHSFEVPKEDLTMCRLKLDAVLSVTFLGIMILCCGAGPAWALKDDYSGQVDVNGEMLGEGTIVRAR